MTTPRTDGFGTGPSRIWRRLAGAGVVALLALLFAPFQTFDDRDSGLWASIVAGATFVGVEISLLASGTSRGGVLIARHAGLGTALGAVLAVALTVWAGDLEWLTIWLLICLPSGALAGAATAGFALLVPRSTAPLVAGLGIVALALLVFLTFRPEPRHDLFAVDPTPQVLAAGGSAGLAENARREFTRDGSTDDLTRSVLWQDVSGRVSAGSGDALTHITFTPDDRLPRSPATGEPVRMITIEVRGRTSSCVVVRASHVDTRTGACEDDDLPR